MDNPIKRYLEDAIAAEKSFETQLNGFAKEATSPAVQKLFSQHAGETRAQYETLTQRLEALGGSPSTVKSFLAHMFNMAPKTAQVGHSKEERTTQDLMMAYSVENAETAMYEAMIAAAESVGDRKTAAIAERIQAQERAAGDKVWAQIAPCATDAVRELDSDKRRDAVITYLQDAEAAERNFEDALAVFAKSGDDKDVQSLMSMMSRKARTQHERLEARLKELGSSTSTTKSFLAHSLAFTPLTAQVGHEPLEKNTQHLMIVYAAAAAECAMYESLASAASFTGDEQTAQLARQLMSEEKEDHRLAWARLAQTAREAVRTVLSK